MACADSRASDGPCYSQKSNSKIIKNFSARRTYGNSIMSNVTAQSNVIHQMTSGDSQSQYFPDAHSFLNIIKNLTRAEKKASRSQLRSELKRAQSLIATIEAREQEVIQCRQISARNKCGSSSKVALKAPATGSKRALQSGNSLFTAKRSKLDTATRPKSDENAKLRANLMRRCATILNTLMSRHELSWIFLQPVDAVKLNLPDYHQIISKPMDLGTIKIRLQKKVYTSPLQFAEDVRLTFTNAMKYNPKEQDAHKMGRALLELFESRWVLLSKQLEKLALTDGVPGDCDINEDEKVVQNHLLSPAIALAGAPAAVRNTNMTDSRRDHQSETKTPCNQNSSPVYDSITSVVSTPTKPNEKHSSRQPGDFEDEEDEDVDIGDDIPVTSIPPVVIDRDCSLTDSSSSSGDSDSSRSDSSSSGSSDSDSESSSSDGSSNSRDSELDDKSDANSGQESRSLTEDKESVCDQPRVDPTLTKEDTKRPLSPIREETLSTIEEGEIVEQEHQAPPDRHVRQESLCDKPRVNPALTKEGTKSVFHAYCDGVDCSHRTWDGGSCMFLLPAGPLSPIREETLSTSQQGKVVEQEHQAPCDRLEQAALLKSRFTETIWKAQQELSSHKPTGADPEKLRREREEPQRKERPELQAEEEAAIASKQSLHREAERQAARQALEQMKMAVEPPANFDMCEGLDSRGSNFQLLLDSELSIMRPGNGNPLEHLRMLMKEDIKNFSAHETNC